MPTGSPRTLPATRLPKIAQDSLRNKSFPVDNQKEMQPAATKLTTKNACRAARCWAQSAGQKPQGKQAEHVA